MLASTATDILGILVTLLLGAVTAYVGLSVRLRTRQDVAAKRFEAYASLWEETGVAAPMMAAQRAPMSEGELAELYHSLTKWYYEEGNGMLLSEQARGVYLRAKNNLVCPVEEYKPESLRTAIVDPEIRSDAAIRQLSLLRTAMRADLAIYAGPFGKKIDEQDVKFLAACEVDLKKKPWRKLIRSARTLSDEHDE